MIIEHEINPQAVSGLLSLGLAGKAGRVGTVPETGDFDLPSAMRALGWGMDAPDEIAPAQPSLSDH